MLKPLHESEKIQVGALIVFDEGVSKKDIEFALGELGKLPNFPMKSCQVKEFYSTWGGPVWYIP